VTHGTDQHPQQPTPRAQAVQAAAQAADVYQAAPDTHTLHTMQSAVQTARSLGASYTDIRAARQTGVQA
jgi:hypothetical protein